MRARAKGSASERREERALVKRMIAGDETALDAFADSYLPGLYRFARLRLAGDAELTREVVQGTVCKALAKIASFRGEAALMTWLCACCRNEIASLRRKRRSSHEVELEEERFPSDAALTEAGGENPERALLRREGVDLVHLALDALPPRYALALEWKYLDDLPVKEIARRLEIGPKAAESLLTRARHSFRGGYARLVADSDSWPETGEINAPKVVSQP